MAVARSTTRAKAWKWTIAGGSLAAFLAMAQVFHIGDASRPSTPVAAGTAAQAAQATQAYGGVTMVCVAGAYGYSCSPVAASGGGPGGGAYGGAYGGGRASTPTFANTRSSGS